MMPVPAAPAYLTSTYASKPSQRGGTLIAEDVTDLATHRERVSTPDGYRPESCSRCGKRPWAHDSRIRRLRDQPDSGFEEIRRYRCRPCGAVWQVLPACIARFLHRTWGAVQSRLVAAGRLAATGAEWRVRSKPSTLHRWLARLETSAAVLTQCLAEAVPRIRSVLEDVGIACARLELVEGLACHGAVVPARKLEEVGCLIHRVAPGLRLM